MPGSNSEGNSTQDTAVDIVVTAPSSPEQRPPANDFRRHTARNHTFPHTHQPVLDHLLDNTVTPMSHTEATSVATEDEDSSRFEQIMSTAFLPPPGPAHFAARRALWRRPVSFPPPRTEQSAKLVDLLEREGPLDGDEVWNRGLDKIWKGVTGGGRLKRRLPMRYLTKILQAGWVRDGTWPRGYTAPDPDDEMAINEPEGTFGVPSLVTSNYSSALATPALEFTDFSTSKNDERIEDV